MNIHSVTRIFMQRFRPARARQIKALFPEIAQQAAVLDVGGTWRWWKDMQPCTSQITIVNLDATHQSEVEQAGYRFMAADGCALPFADQSFDLSFSNSVIEHVGDASARQRFAHEMLRCGRSLYLQTPNKWFFVEPHLIAPFIHWLPFALTRRLVRWCSIWGWVNRPDQATIDAFLKDINLVDRTELEALFPGCQIGAEKFLGMTKSFIVTRPVAALR